MEDGSVTADYVTHLHQLPSTVQYRFVRLLFLLKNSELPGHFLNVTQQVTGLER